MLRSFVFSNRHSFVGEVQVGRVHLSPGRRGERTSHRPEKVSGSFSQLHVQRHPVALGQAALRGSPQKNGVRFTSRSGRGRRKGGLTPFSVP